MEALLFATSEPISIKTFKDILSSIHPFTKENITDMLTELANEYTDQARSIGLSELASGFLLQTNPEFSPYIEQLLSSRKTDKLSHASLEVLAIIAFRQPVTRVKVDEIRGVDSSGSIYALLERGLIEPVGKLEVPGKPTLFGVTANFLKHFGLKDLSALPKMTIP